MDLLGSSDGAIWLAALGQEAIRLDYGQSRWESLSGLWFQTDMPDGSQWFASQDSSAVRFDGQRWQRFGAQEGLKRARGVFKKLPGGCDFVFPEYGPV